MVSESSSPLPSSPSAVAGARSTPRVGAGSGISKGVVIRGSAGGAGGKAAAKSHPAFGSPESLFIKDLDSGEKVHISKADELIFDKIDFHTFNSLPSRKDYKEPAIVGNMSSICLPAPDKV